MATSSFYAYRKARELAALCDDDSLAAVYASSDIDIYPYQIAAARFALRSPYLKGVVLCDEGGLGKTYEALLIAVQKWHEGENNILLVVPTHLVQQWRIVLEQRFSVPSFFVDTEEAWRAHSARDANPFYQDGIVVTTYDFAFERCTKLGEIPWSTAIFDEADALCRIYTGEHKMSLALKAATRDAYKILLTPTPIMTSIMDVYGLIYFIDETALPDPDSFYKRYFRRPERYPELSEQVSRYCFRTLRSQVTNYVKIPRRIPVTAQFSLSGDEQRLSALLDAYLSRPKKAAFPKMDAYDLTLMLTRTLSSSTFALLKTLEGIEKRLAEMPGTPDVQAELEEIRAMSALAASIAENAKGKELLTALMLTIWPGDTKWQGYNLFHNTKSGLEWIYDKEIIVGEHSFEMITDPYLRLAHFQSSIVIEYLQPDYYKEHLGTDKSKCISLYQQITKEWKKEKWDELKQLLLNEHAGLVDEHSFLQQFENKFINSNRGYAHVSFGYETTIYIPHGVVCDYEKRGEPTRGQDKLAELVTSTIQTLIGKIS